MQLAELEAHIKELGVAPEDAAELLLWSQEPEHSQMPAAEEGDATRQRDEYTDNINFLHSCFPSISRALIRLKLAEVENDLEAATDLLLNHESLKDEDTSGQYFDKRTRRRARNLVKQQKKDARQSEKNKDNLVTLSSLLEIPESEAKDLFEQHNSSLANTICWFYRSRGVDSHLRELINEVAPIAVAKTPPENQDPALDIDSTFATMRISQRNIAMVRSRYEEKYRGQTDRLRKYREDGCIHSRTLQTEASRNIHDLREKLKELDILSYRVAAYDRNSSVVDFHHMPLSAAMAVCEDKIADWKRAGAKSELYLITGAGRHSADGVPRIKNAVRRYLQGEGLKFEEDEGAIIVIR